MRYIPVASDDTESLPTRSSYLVVLNDKGEPWTNKDELPIMGQLRARGTEPTNWLLKTQSGIYFCLKGAVAELLPETSMDRKRIVACADSLYRGNIAPAGAIVGATDLLTFNHVTEGAQLLGFSRCEHGYVLNAKPSGADADGKNSFCVEIAQTGSDIEAYLRQEGVLCTRCTAS